MDTMDKQMQDTMEVEELRFQCLLCERADRHAGMTKFIQKLIEVRKGNITVEERNIFAAAYKHVLYKTRVALRDISVMETTAEAEVLREKKLVEASKEENDNNNNNKDAKDDDKDRDRDKDSDGSGDKEKEKGDELSKPNKNKNKNKDKNKNKSKSKNSGEQNNGPPVKTKSKLSLSSSSTSSSSTDTMNAAAAASKNTGPNSNSNKNKKQSKTKKNKESEDDGGSGGGGGMNKTDKTSNPNNRSKNKNESNSSNSGNNNNSNTKLIKGGDKKAGAPPTEKEKKNEMGEIGSALRSEYLQMKLKNSRLYRVQLEQEMLDICQEVIFTVTEKLLPVLCLEFNSALPDIFYKLKSSKDRLEHTLQQEMKTLQEHVLQKIDDHEESIVFYLKMLGDHFRYIAELSESEIASQHGVLHSLATYYIGTELASVYLPPTHPLRLGLALNFSVFYYDIMAQPERACQLAKNAFDEAIAELDQGGALANSTNNINTNYDPLLSTQSAYTHKDTTTVMQMLKDNLTHWTNE